MRLDRVVNDLLVRVFWIQRRLDPYLRPALDHVVKPPVEAVVQWLARRRLPDHHLALAEERLLDGEAEVTRRIVALQTRFLDTTYPPGSHVERAGNTKTYGVLRGVLTVHPELPIRVRHGLFAAPGSYPAWVRCAGPGPLTPPDLRDNAIMSLGVKVMGVPGPKLLPDERGTQDFLCLSQPTFTTPDVLANEILQQEVGNRTGLMYFLRPSHPHLLDLIMSGLYAVTAASPLQVPYWSCVPYLLGEGQAMQYRFVPRARPLKVPRRPGPDYLREAMVRTLAEQDVVLDMLLQLQTDPRRMPIEHAGIVWSPRRSPPITVATLTLPRQRFDSPAQLAFADALSFNPWHALAEHRPLGNQGRARRVVYAELARARQQRNNVPHIEPTGEETFGDIRLESCEQRSR